MNKTQLQHITDPTISMIPFASWVSSSERLGFYFYQSGQRFWLKDGTGNINSHEHRNQWLVLNALYQAALKRPKNWNDIVIYEDGKTVVELQADIEILNRVQVRSALRILRERKLPDDFILEEKNLFITNHPPAYALNFKRLKGDTV